jgi:hypothetical protein
MSDQVDINSQVTADQQALADRISNLVLSRALVTAYHRLSEEKKKESEVLFLSGSNEEKAAFFKQEMPDFEELLKKTLEGLQEELERAVLDQF